MSLIFKKNKRHSFCVMIGLLSVILFSVLVPKEVLAACYRIDNVAASTNQSNSTTVYVEYQTNGRRNDVGSRTGYMGTGKGSGLVPPSINLSSALFQPYNSLIFSGVASTNNMAFGGWDDLKPEQVLYRCDPGEEERGIYEFFATVGTGGMIPTCAPVVGSKPDGDSLGVPGAYRTIAPELGLRLTHVNSGKILRDRWQSNRLVGLDKDSMNYVLVKVKNFSPLQADVFRINNSSYGIWGGASVCKNFANAYYLVNWTGKNTVADGDLNNKISDGTLYAGQFNMGTGYEVTNIGSCGSTIVDTPNVKFKSISAAELNNGGTRTELINIHFKCQLQGASIVGTTPFVSGVNKGQTAMGFAIPATNQQSALTERLGVAGSTTAVSYLLSDGYKTDPLIATNVGTRLNWALNGQPRVNFALYQPAVITGTNADGWYGVKTNAGGGGIDGAGYQYFDQEFIATFEKLPGTTVVNAGNYRASAQFIIRVQ